MLFYFKTFIKYTYIKTKVNLSKDINNHKHIHVHVNIISQGTITFTTKINIIFGNESDGSQRSPVHQALFAWASAPMDVT